MSTMNTLIYQGPKKLIWEEHEISILGEGEALIEVKSVGICGIGIHAWGGDQPFLDYPRVLGHEICGEIAGLDKNIRNLKNGQRVVATPYVACQQYLACLSGRINHYEKISVIGAHQDGGFSRYLSVPITNLLDTWGIDPQAAALIKLYTISAHAVRRAAVAPNEQVPVIGTGLIGLGATAIAKTDGTQVVVADTGPARRGYISSRLGLPVIDPPAGDLNAQLRAQFGSSLAQEVVDAMKNQHVMSNTMNLTHHGDSIVFVGLFKGDLQSSDPEFHKKEITMVGSRNAASEDFVKVDRLMLGGELTVGMMFTHRYAFAILTEIYERDVINNRELTKGVITF